MNSIKYYFRFLLKQRFTSIVSVIGISIGFASCLIIGLYISTELSFDNFHSNKENIYRLLSKTEAGNNSADVNYRLGPDCVENISGVTEYARLYNFWGPNSLRYNNEIFKADRLFFTDPGIVDIFSFSFVEGNKHTAFEAPGSLIITKSTSEKYFGKTSVIGKTLVLDNNETITITGVVNDFPLNSHIHFDFLVYEPNRVESWGDWLHKSWTFSNFKTYVLFQKNYSKEQFYTEFKNFSESHVDDENKEFILNTKLQNLSDIHLHSKHVESDFNTKGNIDSIIVLISLALCILLIGTINYVSLSISNVSKRAKEVGIRKISGANNANIFVNSIIESVILSTFSLIIAFIIVKIIHSKLYNYINLNFEISDLKGILFISSSVLITLTIAILSGMYVSRNVLKHKPIDLLRGHQLSKYAGFSKSNVFLSIQFSISIVLIISSALIFKQLNHVQTKNLGYESDMVLSIPISKTLKTKEVFKESLLRNPRIKDITISSSFPPNGYHNANVFSLDNLRGKSISVKNFFVDFNFNKFLNLKIIEGRDFLKGNILDEKEAALVNQAFVEKMGWKTSIGKRIKNSWNNKELKVIGIVEDFHFKSLHEKIEPVLISISSQKDLYYMGVKFNGSIVKTDIDLINSEWKKINPANLFEYQFLDDIVNQHYLEDKKQARTILLFSLLAIVITCMGLIATSVFLAKQRIKEIGIRKVNGAKVSEILTLLNKDFIKWVAIAFVIACPVAYYAMNKWLENFAYKTTLSWWIFALAGVLALGIALLTVSFQSWKAATRNPVEALRYE